MAQYTSLDVKLSNSHFNKLKSGGKNGTEVTLGDSKDETNFTLRSLLTDTQLSRLNKAFANNSSAHIKLSKTQLSKIL